LGGDGVGPEVCDAAMEVLAAVRPDVGLVAGLIGGPAHDAHGVMLPEETIALIDRSDAVFVGALGAPKWDSLPVKERPEQALLWLRTERALFANLRPVGGSGHGRTVAGRGLDRTVHVFRELTGDLYFGEPRGSSGEAPNRTAFDTALYTEHQIARYARFVLRFAGEISARVLNVDKANVLYSSSLWREVVKEVHAAEFPDVDLQHMHVDAASYELLRRPGEWEVVLAPNLFGDIISEEMGIFAGSIGMLASASMGESGPHLYEPVHGSAPDLTGSGNANPCGAILSAALLCRWSLGDEPAARAIEGAVDRAIERAPTRDLGGDSSGRELSDAVLAELESPVDADGNVE
jgi:3-isopropylmalate dehydrogenase